MRLTATATNLAILAVFVLWGAVTPGRADSKPGLAAEIQSIVDSQGVAAAKQRFAEIYPAHAAEYEVDMQGMMNLAQQYMAAGDMEKGMAVAEMGATLATGMTSQMLNSAPAGSSAQVMAQMQEQERIAQAQQAADEEAAREERQNQQQAQEAQSRGKARDDLGRFTGLYGPEGSKRNLWVMKSCDGYLVSGASWGDAANWWMRSAADSVFTYQDSFTSFSMEFQDSAGGMTMKHDLGEVIDSPLTRNGPVPADWGECLERPLR